MPQLPIRYKKVCHSSELASSQDPYQQGTYKYYTDEPIREWRVVPYQKDVYWKKDKPLPSDALITVQYAEIDLWKGKDSGGHDSYLSLGFTDFKFRFEKMEGSNFFDIVFLKHPKDSHQRYIQSDLTGYHSDPDNAIPLQFRLRFKNFNALSQDSTSLKVKFAIYATNPHRQKVQLEAKEHVTRVHLEKSKTTQMRVLGDGYLVFYELKTKFFYGNLKIKILNNDDAEPLYAVFDPDDRDGALEVKPNYLFSAFDIAKTEQMEQIYLKPTVHTYHLQIRKKEGDLLLFTVSLVLSVIEGSEPAKKEDEPLCTKTIKPYNFCMDPVKITVKPSALAVERITMKLQMHFEDNDKQTDKVEQAYDFIFFKEEIHLYPGEEIQDFFSDIPSFSWKLSDFTEGKILKPKNNFKMAVVDIQVIEKDRLGKPYASYNFKQTRWIPGKKPKAFPYLTNGSLRRTFSSSLISINSLQESFLTKKLGNIASHLIDTSEITDETYLVCAFFRRSFADLSYGATQMLKNDFMALEPIPNPCDTLDVIFQNQNYCPDWFTFSGEWQRLSELKHTLSDNFKGIERKAAVEETVTVKLNTGWIFAEEIALLNELIQSPVCFAFLENQWVRLIPIEQKPLSYNSQRNLHQQLITFKLIKDDER